MEDLLIRTILLRDYANQYSPTLYMGMVCEQFAVIDAEMTEKITLQMFYSPDSLNVTSENE